MPDRGRAVLLLAVALTLAAARAQTNTTLTVEREENDIVITQRALAADGARSVLSNRNCEDGILTNIFFGPPANLVETRIGETILTSTVAVIRVPQGEEGQPRPKDQETIELYGGEVAFNRPGCIENEERNDEATVLLEQGRTTVRGSNFFIDREADRGRMAGPVTLARAADEGGDPVEASADALELDLGSEIQVLEGNVRVTSGERVSEAERLELDEDKGLATLTGSPARSSKGDSVLEGETLLYYLDSNDVVVIGGVQGTIEIED